MNSRALWWFYARGVALGLALDLALAYGLHQWLNPDEAYGWAFILAAIWAIGIAWSLKRWLYRLLGVYLNQGAITEAVRQQLVEAKIPLPPRFGLQLQTYLLDVAMDKTVDDEARICSAILAKEVSMTAQNMGLLAGTIATLAADKGLDKHRR